MAREMVDALPDARLCLLEGCAHVPQLQEPAAFLSAIREFINQP
jgi:3-oxoadipate enol-lactonase